MSRGSAATAGRSGRISTSAPARRAAATIRPATSSSATGFALRIMHASVEHARLGLRDRHARARLDLCPAPRVLWRGRRSGASPTQVERAARRLLAGGAPRPRPARSRARSPSSEPAYDLASAASPRSTPSRKSACVAGASATTASASRGIALRLTPPASTREPERSLRRRRRDSTRPSAAIALRARGGCRRRSGRRALRSARREGRRIRSRAARARGRGARTCAGRPRNRR